MSRYPDFIQRLLLHEDTLQEPLPKEPSNWELVMRIRGADIDTLLGGETAQPNAPMELLRAGLFYFHNALDDAHRELGASPGEVAAYWHGMVHRREGDFENARHWMRRAGELPVFLEMQGRAGDHSPHMTRQPAWDPFLFTLLCEQFKFGETAYKAEIAHLQKVEFAVIFDYVWRRCVKAKAEG